MTRTNAVEQALAQVFGRAWYQLTPQDQALIVRDCTEDGGVAIADMQRYRSNIGGPSNLQAYANTMRVRFSK
jgi:hypothetical protein